MFNGIVETTGKIIDISGGDSSKEFTLEPNIKFDDLFIGASIAINGVCLTVTRFNSTEFSVTAVPETLKLTNLNYLKINDTANLERPIKSDSRIGGHYVQGHVDTTGEILNITNDGNAKLIKIKLPTEHTKYIVKKGYIAIDGMSITVIDINNNNFTVTLIPETLNSTIAKNYKPNKLVNLETDIFGKYIEKLSGAKA